MMTIEEEDDISESWRKQTCHIGAPLTGVDGASYLLVDEEASPDGELKRQKMVEHNLVVKRSGVNRRTWVSFHLLALAPAW
jgi:hypothetical protein